MFLITKETLGIRDTDTISGWTVRTFLDYLTLWVELAEHYRSCEKVKHMMISAVESYNQKTIAGASTTIKDQFVATQACMMYESLKTCRNPTLESYHGMEIKGLFYGMLERSTANPQLSIGTNPALSFNTIYTSTNSAAYGPYNRFNWTLSLSQLSGHSTMEIGKFVSICSAVTQFGTIDEYSVFLSLYTTDPEQQEFRQKAYAQYVLDKALDVQVALKSIGASIFFYNGPVTNNPNAPGGIFFTDKITWGETTLYSRAHNILTTVISSLRTLV